MTRLGCLLAAVAVSLPLACATGPTYEDLEASLPPLAAGVGRIFVYLPDSTEVPSFFPQLTLDGAPLGTLRTGTYLYADRPAGHHVVDVHVREEAAAFGSQGKTDPVDVMLAPGERVYIAANTLAGIGLLKVTLTPVPPDAGERDMQSLHPAPEKAE